MFYWIPYAFVRITAAFIAGIILNIVFPDVVDTGTGFILVLVLTTAYFLIVFINERRRRYMINPGFTGLTVVFICGYMNAALHRQDRWEDHISRVDKITRYTAVAVAQAEEKSNSWRQVLQVRAIYDSGRWHHASGRVMAYFPKSDPAVFRYGDVLLIQGSPRVVPGPANPGQFDYQRYLSWRNIFHQHFIRSGEAQLVGHDPPSAILDYSIKVRIWALSILERHIAGDRELAIAQALVLGVTEDLDNELTGAYAASGAMHVLAVSGLHVGILYMIIAILLKPLNRTAGGKWIFMLVSMCMLWGYACVTGLSPSVLRAVAMFSFFALARPLNYRTNIFNTLASSAFCLLLYDPFLIASVGFQLSYLAVIGIVWLHPMLYRLWEPESRVWDEVWKISAVSIAAQLITTPLTLFYFHQFPNYFLFANLFIIPLSTAVLAGGLALLAVGWLEPVAAIVGWVENLAITFLNYLVFKVQQLPYAVRSDIQISMLQCLFLTGSIVTLMLFFQLRNRKYLIASWICILGFGIDSWYQHTRLSGCRLVVYSVRGGAFDVIDNGIVYAFLDSAMRNEKRVVDFSISPARGMYGGSAVRPLEGQVFARELNGGKLIRIRDRTILYLDRAIEVADTITVDFLILSKGVSYSAEAVLGKISAGTVILDGSYSYFVADKTLHSLPEQLRVHSVVHHGAFEAKF